MFFTHEEMPLEASQTTLTASEPEQTTTRPAVRGKSHRASEQDGSQKKQSRRGLLRKGLEAAVATVGAGAMLAMETGTSVASSHPHPNIPGNFSSSDPNIPAVQADGTNGADGVLGTSDSGVGVYGTTASASAAGVSGYYSGSSDRGTGVIGTSSGYGHGVYGNGARIGVYGVSTNVGVEGDGTNVGVQGNASGTGTGVQGTSPDGVGVEGSSQTHTGVQGTGPYVGVEGDSPGVGVYGNSPSYRAVVGDSAKGVGVYGTGGYMGVLGESTSGYGVVAQGTGPLAVALSVTGKIQADSAGLTAMTQATAITVSCKAVTANSAILVTPIVEGQIPWTSSLRVRGVTPGVGFTIVVYGGTRLNAKYSWLVIN